MFFLADRLKMTVGEMGQRMSNQEYVEWSMYHGRRAQKEQLAAKRR